MLITKNCENCGIEFSRIISRDRLERTKFCSRKCLGLWTANQRGWDGIPWEEKDKEYHKEYSKNWFLEHPDYAKNQWAKDSIKAYHKKYTQTKEYKLSRVTIRYKNRYGITENDYNEMYKSQEGLCAICGNPPKMGQRLYVDHNHNTGEVRALLCQLCNSGLGSFKENIKLLSSAITYLETYKEED